MIEVVSETGSTNADLIARISGGDCVAEGNWLVTDRQTSGRGRQGRKWLDGAGNFMGSTVVRPAPRDPPAHSLALVAGLAVHAAVEPHCPDPAALKLKWPNDLMVGGAKLCGILLERAGDAVVIGIGVNLLAAPQLPDRETVALSAFGPAPDRDAFAAALAAAFDREVERWRTYGLEPVIRRWLKVGTPEGTALCVHEPDGTAVHGSFAGLDATGAMLLCLDNGASRAIHAGDVFLT